MFNSAMQLNGQAFTQKRYDAAFHFLNAALYLASDEKNELGLMEVESRAIEQLARIDEQVPEYHHSTRCSTERGRISVFALLARQANAKQTLLNMDARLQESTEFAKNVRDIHNL